MKKYDIKLTNVGIKEIKRIIRELKNGQKINCIEWEKYTAYGTVNIGFDCNVCEQLFPKINRPDCPQAVYTNLDIIKILSKVINKQ